MYLIYGFLKQNFHLELGKGSKSFSLNPSCVLSLYKSAFSSNHKMPLTVQTEAVAMLLRSQEQNYDQPWRSMLFCCCLSSSIVPEV